MTWILIQPTPDVEGQFVAHHLDLDVAVRGDTPREALANCLREVVVELAEVVQPPKPPEEYYDTLRAVRELGTPATLDEPRDAWVVEVNEGAAEVVVGLNLRDHPGLKIVVYAPEPDLP